MSSDVTLALVMSSIIDLVNIYYGVSDIYIYIAIKIENQVWLVNIEMYIPKSIEGFRTSLMDLRPS